MDDVEVLCGPILRRVERRSVSVFLLTRHPADVRLEVVRAPSEGAVLAGGRRTVALGSGLHAVVATATPVNDRSLEWGERAFYRVRVNGQTLDAPGVLLPDWDRGHALTQLVYTLEERLHHFVVPAADPARLRLLTGSCRKPHGAGGPDALVKADDLLTATHATDGAPQQLLLTGDLIYADDVHPRLLARVIDLSDTLHGTTERAAVRGGGVDLAPNHRARDLAAAGLTSGEADNHLVLLGEFYTMYLLALSPVAWPAALRNHPDLEDYAKSLDQVRRALAHVSTLSLFDDHEVTDDWYLRRGWTDAVLGSDFGRRVLRNGLCAYAVFQHWGNDPAAFTGDRPGAKLLALLDGWDGTGDRMAQVEALLGMRQPGEPLDADDPGCVRWDYTWEGPLHRVVALDTRTRRCFPGDGLDLMSAADIDAALVPDPAGRLTVALSPAPVLGIRLIEYFQDRIDPARVDAEHWAGSATYRHLLDRLLACTPAVALSGDVHYGFAATLVDDQADQKLVSFTASALHNKSAASDLILGGRVLESMEGATPADLPRRQVVSVGDRELVEELVAEPDAPLLPGERVLEADRARSAVMGGNNLGEVRFGDSTRHLLLVQHEYDQRYWRTRDHVIELPAGTSA